VNSATIEKSLQQQLLTPAMHFTRRPLEAAGIRCESDTPFIAPASGRPLEAVVICCGSDTPFIAITDTFTAAMEV
jgi:hypothetical protein